MAIEKNSVESDDKPKKPKRVLSDKQKEALKKGRERRHELMKNPKKSLLTKKSLFVVNFDHLCKNKQLCINIFFIIILI